jgi:hypothetical protein
MWGSVPKHSLKALALVVCLMVLSAMPAVCAGQREASLADVQRLMAELDYPSALKLLARIQREHPEQRDETQRLIMQIISNQGKEYNQVLTQLIHTLYEEQNADKALPLIDILHKLDPTRSDEEMRKSLLYVKFLKLMDSAAALLNQGRIAEAIDLYLLPIRDPAKAGFDMDKQRFDSAGYGNIVTSSVQDAVGRIVQAAVRARGQVSSSQAARDAIMSLVTSVTSAQSPALLDQALSPLTPVRQEESAVLSAVASLDAVSSTMGANEGGQSYLRYLNSLCEGRKGKPPEGIGRAISMVWEPEVESAADAAARAAASVFSDAGNLLNQGDMAAAEPKLRDAYMRAILAVKTFSFLGGGLGASPSWSFSPADSQRMRKLLEKVTQNQEIASEASSLMRLIAMERQAQALPSVTGLSVQALQAARAQALALQDSSVKEKDGWLARAAELGQQQSTGLELAPQIASANAMAARFGSFSAQLSGTDQGYAVNLARTEAAQFETRLSEEVKQRLDGQDRMNGTVNGKPPTQDVFLERRPGEALKLFNGASNSLSSLESDMAAFRSKWGSDPSYASSGGRIAAVLAGLDGIDSKIRTESSELSRLTQLAEQQHEQALAKRKEADLAFADGSRALSAKHYDSAKLQLSDARDLYLDSLLLEEDAAVRKRYTVDIPALINNINNAIVEQYVADVDAQVNAGRRLFSAGEFLKAFLTLETAKARWKATLGDRPNSELDALLEQTRNALRVSGGRDLAPDDSRAPAVNGFLNLAFAKVSRAEKMQKNDSRRKTLLDDAYGNVMSALDVAPVYRTAKALQLRIRKLQAKDDAAFRAEAKAQIDEIISEYKAKRGQPERLYFDLKDYQDIMPDYPPLQQTLQALEISLGFRIRPPSGADITRSNDLLTEARTVYDPANPLTYDPALADLDTAIRLNPSNAGAIALRRTILLKQGSPEASAISAGDLSRFAESKRLYNTEDYAGAYRILQGLVSTDKRNASYPPLAQLYLLTQQKLGLK